MFLSKRKVTFGPADEQGKPRSPQLQLPCFDRVEDAARGLCFVAAMSVAWLAAGPATKPATAAFASTLLLTLIACLVRRATLGRAPVCSLRTFDCLLFLLQSASLAFLVSRLQSYSLVAVYAISCVPSSLQLQPVLCKLVIAVCSAALHPFDLTSKIVVAIALFEVSCAAIRLSLPLLLKLPSEEALHPREPKESVNTAVGLLVHQGPQAGVTSTTSIQKFSCFHDAESNALFSAKGQVSNRLKPANFFRMNERVSAVVESSDTKVSTDLDTASRSNQKSRDRIHSKILSEYFTMIEDLIVLVDEELVIVSNNYSAKPELNIPSAIRSSIGLSADARLKVGTSLSENLDLVRNSPTKCNEQTLRQLAKISEALEFKRRKADYYHLKKFRQNEIDTCLFEIEKHEELLYQRDQHNAVASKMHFSSTGNARTSLREVNFLQAGLIVASSDQTCNFCVLETLYLLREYMRKLKSVASEQELVTEHKELHLTFFLAGDVQMRVRLFLKEGNFYLLINLENIMDKIRLGELNSKLNFSCLLLQSLSHELNTPLHQILGLTSLVSQKIGSAANGITGIEDNIESIFQIARGLQITLQNLLDFASAIDDSLKLQLTQFKASSLFEFVFESLKAKARHKKLLLTYDCDEKLELTSDFNRLAGLLHIFLENSLKFTFKGGVRVSAESDGSKVAFKVIDSGLGISQPDLAIIREIMRNPFLEIRTKSAAGLGIGFRIGQQILKSITTGELEIQIKSVQGRGTTISFEVPVNFEQNCSVKRASQWSSAKASDAQCNPEADLADDQSSDFSRERVTLNFSLGNHGRSPFDMSLPKQTKEQTQTPGFRINSASALMRKSRWSPKTTMPMPEISPHHHFDQQDESLHESEDGDLSLGNDFHHSAIATNNFFNKKRALVVDDDIYNSDIAKLMLESLGFFVETANSGDEAIRVCEDYLQNRIRLDVVFLDYNMPGERFGDDVSRELRADRFEAIMKATPIIGLTANTDEATREKCLASGMNSVQTKPYELQRLQQLLRGLQVL